jgi:hypothetical protein
MLASALVGATVLPSFAQASSAGASDDTFQNIVFFPVRVLGSAVGTAWGVPLGMVKDGTKGAIMSTKWVAGAILGAPFGIAGGAAYGTFDGGWHGMTTGYEKPFSKEAFTFKDE